MAKEQKEKSNKTVLFIVIVIILAAGAFGGFYFGMSKNSEGSGTVEVKEAFYDLGEIFVNLSDEDGDNYVKLTLSVAYNSGNKDLVKELEEKNVSLKDGAIFYFKSCKANDFNPGNESKLKSNLITKLNEELNSGEILDVKFSELLIQ